MRIVNDMPAKDRVARQPAIVQYWHHGEVPCEIAELLATFHAHNPDLCHLVFSEKTADAFIAERFTAREVAAFRACAVPAMQADYFRYCAVLALGGLYSDADCSCIAGLRPLIPVDGGGHLFRGPAGNVTNGLFAFGAPGHAFLELALEIATVNIERRTDHRVYWTTGPPIFASLVGLHQHGSFDGLFARIQRWPRGAEIVRSYCDAIGDYARVRHAFEGGVEVLGPAEYQPFVQAPRVPLRYIHWTTYDGEIFRST